MAWSVPQEAGVWLFNVVQVSSSVIGVHTVHLGVLQVSNVAVNEWEVLGLLAGVVHL